LFINQRKTGRDPGLNRLNDLPGIMRKNTFIKEERLCNNRLIENLFHNGSSFVLYPFRLVFSETPVPENTSSSMVKVLITVPKRKIRKAAHRNLVKRRIREAYRHHKGELFDSMRESDLPPFNLAIQYLSSEILDYELISSKLLDALNKVNHEYTKLYLGENH